MLENFKGILQTDGFGVYDEIAEKKGITLIHCMAHARRYFIEAMDTDKDRVEYALDQSNNYTSLKRIALSNSYRRRSAPKSDKNNLCQR